MNTNFHCNSCLSFEIVGVRIVGEVHSERGRVEPQGEFRGGFGAVNLGRLTIFFSFLEKLISIFFFNLGRYNEFQGGLGLINLR